MLERLPEGVAVLCTTATANDRVVADVAEQLKLGHAGALRTYRGPLGARVAAARGRRAAGARRPARVARDPSARAAGLRHRLHAHQARRRDGRASSSTPTASPPRPTAARSTPRRGSRSRSGCCATSSRRRGHQRARDGLRQARPRLRRPLPGARQRDQLLPAGRPRRARDRARRRRAAARRRGPPDPGLLHRAGVPAAGPRRARAGGARGRRDDAAS